MMMVAGHGWQHGRQLGDETLLRPAAIYLSNFVVRLMAWGSDDHHRAVRMGGSGMAY